MFRLRHANLPDDYTHMAAILNASRVLPTTAEELAGTQSRWPEGSVLLCRIAEDESEQVIGFAEAYRFPNTAEGKFYANVVVHPASRNKGIGSILLRTIEQFVVEHDGNRLVGDVEDIDVTSLAFMEKRGYRVERHGYDSTLDLSGLKEPPNFGDVATVEATGIRFFTLADSDTPETRRALYELYGRTMVDIPGYEAKSFMTYQTWSQFVIERQEVRLDWIFIAANNDCLVGVTQITNSRDHVYTTHTLVDREYRGRGIAKALKLLTIEAAIQHGAPYMRTGNDSLNGPMLAVNQKLGYKPVAGDYTVTRHV